MTDNTEREAVVAWLRDRARVHRSNAGHHVDHFERARRLERADENEAAADQILRGDHLSNQEQRK